MIQVKALVVQQMVLFCSRKEEKEMAKVVQYAESVFESVKWA